MCSSHSTCWGNTPSLRRPNVRVHRWENTMDDTAEVANSGELCLRVAIAGGEGSRTFVEILVRRRQGKRGGGQRKIG